ncbi:hypothetical protein OC834_003206 [Tilletia horrida]|uniref:DnaJ-domain-containing protein n=1 Tax=Tilletia horrida TaxID=155126 RepID=A0AAN6JLP0_9BASI|nr:hypothetical protein OC834_003206 [Tilletia horrida]KAK0533242.1 hypothetical protein OC842_003026 [Tilletia horrida]
MVADTELYDVLGVAPDASEQELKQAFRKQSLAHHPDKNPGDETASARFQEISAAYETLSDPDARAAYDRYGTVGGGGGGGGGDGPGPDMDEFFSFMFGEGAGFGGPPPGFEFGGGMPGGGGMPRGFGRRKAQSSVITYEVSLEDLYKGKTAHFSLEKNTVCATCSGSGGKAGATPKTCVKCGGEGFVLNRQMTNGMIHQRPVQCSDCKGEGVKIRDKDRCKKCKGQKTLKNKAKLDLKIKPGMHDGEKITFQGEGDEEPGVSQAGDIVFVLKLKTHPTFEIRPDQAGEPSADLEATVHLTLSEALLGFDRTVLTHLDGRSIRINKRTGHITRPGDVQCLRGEGMPQGGLLERKGDLYINWVIDFPDEDWLAKTDTTSLARLLPAKRPDIPSSGPTTTATPANVETPRESAPKPDAPKPAPKETSQPKPKPTPASDAADEPETIFTRIREFSTCEVSDALIKLKVPHGGHVPGIDIFSPEHIDGETRVCGPAFTVKKDKDAPKPPKHFVDASEPGSVMFVTCPPNTRSAIWGGLMTARAQAIGVKGVILDGRCRDLAEHRESGFPVFARGHSTLGQSPFTRPSELQVPITISDPSFAGLSSAEGEHEPFPSVTINPGDVVLADMDGVVVFSPELAEQVLELAAKGREVDGRCMDDLHEGHGIAETFKKHRG